MLRLVDSFSDFNDKLQKNLSSEATNSFDSNNRNRDFDLIRKNKPRSRRNSAKFMKNLCDVSPKEFDQDESRLDRMHNQSGNIGRSEKRSSRHYWTEISEADKSSGREVSCHAVAIDSKKLMEQDTGVSSRPSIVIPLRKLSQESMKNLQEEEIDSDYEAVHRPSLIVPLRRLSQNFEQVMTNFFQAKPDVNQKLTKNEQIKSKMCDVLDDKEELRKFKEFVRNNYVTTNVGAQQMFLWYAESKETEVSEQTDYFVRRASFSNPVKHESFSKPTKCLSRSNSHPNKYRVEKDEKGGYKWINAPDIKKVQPIRRRASMDSQV